MSRKRSPLKKKKGVPPKKKRKSPSIDRKENDPPKYKKDRRTSGYNGYVYEYKLASLIHLNLKHNDKVENFLLATNLPAAWPFDDVCFKINWKDVERKPTVVLIQAKHKINEENLGINLVKYFEGYKAIKNKFNNEDGLFKGNFDECECYFILYTNEDFKFKTVPVTDHNYCPELNYIIKTVADGTVSRLNETEKKKLTKEWSENDKLIWEHFLNSLLLFSGQANEKDVEEVLKDLITCHQPPSNSFPVKREAATALYIREFEDWWKQLDEAPYLTEKHDILKMSFNKIVNEPVVRSLNIIYKSKIKHCYTFSDDAVSSLNFQDHSCTVIIAENSVLTVVKVMQHLRNEEHVVIDLESIASLRYGERKALCEELKANNENVLVLVCDKMSDDDAFQDIGEAVKNRKRILISNNNKLSQKFKELFPAGAGEEYREVHDEKNSLTDMSEESQSNILETTTVMFQDKEVKLADIVDDISKKYVKGNVLHKILIGETIVVGKLIVDRYYNKMKHFWIDRFISSDSSTILVDEYGEEMDELLNLETFYVIKDEVVLLTADPGMGKTTLLTHLSIKTKEKNPKVWIVRINLLEYSEEFSKWKENKTVITLLEILKFMCQILFYKKFGREHDVKLTLEENDNVVHLKNCTADPLTEFELKLFLHFYCEREVILLFDGFDEIWPHYAEVVIKCLKTLTNDPRKHRVWITSRSYEEVKTILEKELKLKSQNIYDPSGSKYLQKFWEYTLKVDELNDAQLENVKKLFEHMSSTYNRPKKNESINEIIYNAALYLSYKIQNTHIPLWKYDKKYHEIISPISNYSNTETNIFPPFCPLCSCCWYCQGTCENDICTDYPELKNDISMNLLVLYLVAVDVEHNIKKESGCEEWYLNVETYTVYERFLKNKIKKRYQEKNGMNIYIPDVITAYENELADSILKHKKLGAYTIFYDNRQKLFSERDLEEINDLIDKLRNGEEKTGIIVSVNDFNYYNTIFPIFIHQTFAEYFAVEYICDRLKIENISESTILSCFDCLDLMCFENVHIIFDKKIAIDRKLMNVLENNKVVIFNRLIRKWSWIFDRGVMENFMSFFRDVVEYAIGKSDIITIPEEKKIELVNVINRKLRKMQTHGAIRHNSESESEYFSIQSYINKVVGHI